MNAIFTRLTFFITLVSLSFNANAANDDSTSTTGFFDDATSVKYNNVYALLIGVSTYKELKPNLTYADDDAELMYNTLAASFPDQKENFKMVVNEEATDLRIYSEIETIAAKAKQGDLVIIYFAGHGDVQKNAFDEKKGFFLAHNASSSKNYISAGGTISFDFVYDYVNKIGTLKLADVWLVADACRSGGLIELSDATAIYSSFSTANLKAKKLLSSGEDEVSHEYNDLQHGVFTYFLARALSGAANKDEKANVLNIKEIREYLEDSVYAYVQSNSSSEQTPSLTGGSPKTDVFNVIPEITSFLNPLAMGDGKNDTAMRGDGEDSEKSDTYKRFLEQLREDNLRERANSAFSIYKEAKTAKSVSVNELDAMKRKLAEALLQKGQDNTNSFLMGYPITQGDDSYKTTSKDFELAYELLGTNHPLSPSIKLRADFFAAMDKVNSSDAKAIEQAEHKLIELAASNPDVPYINQGLAMLYVKLSQKSKAEEQLSAASEKLSTWSKPKNTAAYLKIVEGKLEEAQHIIEESKNNGKEANLGNIFILQAQLNTANYELQTAVQNLSQISDEDSNIPESVKLALAAKIEEMRGRINVATQTYEQALNKGGANLELLIKLGDLYAENLDTAQALNYYNQARTMDAKHQGVRAKIALMKGKKDLDLDEENINYSDVDQIVAIVSAYEAAGSYQNAINVLNKSIANIDWNPELYWLLAKNQFSIQDVDASKKSLRKALEISPYHFKSIRSLAYIHLHEKHNTVAIALIEKHDKYFPNSAKWLTFSYYVYKMAGNKNDLFPLLERAIKMDSLETDSYRELYKLHLENLDFENALREYRVLMDIGGGVSDSIKFYDKAELEIDRAVSNYYFESVDVGLELFLKLDPYNAKFNYYMAWAKYMNGEYEEAKKYLKVVNGMIDEFDVAVQVAFYDLKGKVYLETDDFRIADGCFAKANGNRNPDYLGMSMVYYEQKNPNWVKYFRMGGDQRSLNEDALKRYEKMKKKADKIGPYGGTERNR